jgi:MerR family transcriptional regulator, thiopeptide resistance regulator
MWTATKLAQACGLSRTTLLYYESVGLLKPPPRSQGNYRCYGDKDLRRLQQICVYRDSGLKLADIQTLLDGAGSGAAEVLERRLAEINTEIARLREHQKSICRMLEKRNSFGRTKVITKEKWVTILRNCGFSDEDMKRWHAEFEKSAPAEHQEFLEFLHIQPAEIDHIREWSRAYKKA